MKHYERKILEKMGLRPSQKILDKLHGKDLNIFNEHRQKIKGKEEYEYFEITEPGCSEKSIFEYKNIKDWDEKNFNFQEKSRKEGVKEQRKWQKKRGDKLSKKYKIKDYTHLYMSGDWFRALEISEISEKRKLIYGQLESANSYVLIQTLEKLNEEIEKVYPFIYARGYGVSFFEPSGKKGYSKMTDMEKRAAGKEKELDKLQKKLRDITDDIERDIVKDLIPYSNYTFRNHDDSPQMDGIDNFIIGGFKAAKKINFKTFFYDFYELRQPFEVLDIIVKKTTKKYKKVLFK